MLLPVYYEPNMLIYSQIGICSYISNFGHNVTWVLSSKESKIAEQLLLNGVHVYVIPYIHSFSGSSLFARTLNRIPNILRRMHYILKIFREGGYNLIFVSDGVLDGLVAAYIKRRYKVPFVFQLSNPLEFGWEVQKIEPQKPKILYYLRAKLGTLIGLYLLRKADLVLPVTKWYGEGLIKKGISASKITPCPSGVDIACFANKDGKGVREKYNLSDAKVIIYVGTLGKGRHLNILIEAFSKVRKERGRARLLMVGEGSDRGNLVMLANELGIREDVTFTGQVPQSEVPDFIAAADIGICPVPPLSFYRVNSPVKLFEYMAVAKPVVANEEIFEHKGVLKQSGGGILVRLTPDAFADAIIELLDNPEKAAQMGMRGREWVVKNRNYEILAKDIERAYYGILEE